MSCTDEVFGKGRVRTHGRAVAGIPPAARLAEADHADCICGGRGWPGISCMRG